MFFISGNVFGDFVGVLLVLGVFMSVLDNFKLILRLRFCIIFCVVIMEYVLLVWIGVGVLGFGLLVMLVLFSYCIVLVQ